MISDNTIVMVVIDNYHGSGGLEVEGNQFSSVLGSAGIGLIVTRRQERHRLEG